MVKPQISVFVLIGVTAGAGFFYGIWVRFPLVNPHKSVRFISQAIRETMRFGERLAMYGDFGINGTVPYRFLYKYRSLF